MLPPLSTITSPTSSLSTETAGKTTSAHGFKKTDLSPALSMRAPCTTPQFDRVFDLTLKLPIWVQDRIFALHIESHSLDLSCPKDLPESNKLTDKQLKILLTYLKLLQWNNQITDISLANNRLTDPATDSFASFTCLNHLDLSNNQISSLRPNWFMRLSGLTRLNLASNQLAEIAPSAFRYNPALEFLSLQGNRLTTLPADVFDHQKSLLTLDLSENVFEGLLPETLFAHQQRLQELNLGLIDSAVLPFGIFSNLIRLNSLELNANEDDYSFEDLRGWFHGNISTLIAIAADVISPEEANELLGIQAPAPQPPAPAPPPHRALGPILRQR